MLRADSASLRNVCGRICGAIPGNAEPQLGEDIGHPLTQSASNSLQMPFSVNELFTFPNLERPTCVKETRSQNLTSTVKNILLLSALALASCQADDAKHKNPIEVGAVSWLRDHPSALAQSKKSGKPIFLLFQEVPGCAGCKQFGKDVLSDPSVVKSIEENFIPLLIHNNKGGKDLEILNLYHEPSWNYQVVRFLDADGNDLIPRKDRVWTSEELHQRMNAVLEKSARTNITTAPKTERLAISQYCFWTGEMKIGAIDGVTCTEAGFHDGREVTLVDYDPTKTSPSKIYQQAKLAGVGTGVYLDDPSLLPGAKKLTSDYRAAPTSDQKKQLQGTVYQKLNLTPEQATKLNAFARTNPSLAMNHLTPSQKKQLTQ